MRVARLLLVCVLLRGECCARGKVVSVCVLLRGEMPIPGVCAAGGNVSVCAARAFTCTGCLRRRCHSSCAVNN